MKRDKIIELMQVCGTSDRCFEAMTALVDRFTTGLKQFTGGDAEDSKAIDDMLVRVKNILEARYPEYNDLMVDAYSETYSEEEIDELLNFYRSPLGLKMLNAQPVLSERITKASEDWSNNLTRDLTNQLERGDLLPN